MSISHIESSDFNKNRLKELKGDKKLYVVFSTFGEREAQLIYDKISLLKNELGDLIDKIYLSHRRASSAMELTEEKAMEADEETEIILCNDFQVPDMGNEKGKGADMRRTLYHINKTAQIHSQKKTCIVYLDADVVPEHFGIHFVIALASAVFQGNDFAKASFWRAMGRVKKFVAQPLFSVVDHPSLRGLSHLAYPLSGEVAGTIEFFNSVHFWQIYGVETGINIDSIMGQWNMADVNLGLYDHEHHGDEGIQKMSFGIMRTYLKQLEDYGLIEFKDGASISDTFNASMINEDGERENLFFDLTEEKYQPVKNIL